MIKIGFTIDDEALEADIAQAQVDAKEEGKSPDEFLANAARSGFEQYRGSRKRLVVTKASRFAELINMEDPEQTQWAVDLLTEIEAKLEALQPPKK